MLQSALQAAPLAFLQSITEGLQRNADAGLQTAAFHFVSQLLQKHSSSSKQLSGSGDVAFSSESAFSQPDIQLWAVQELHGLQKGALTECSSFLSNIVTRLVPACRRNSCLCTQASRT